MDDAPTKAVDYPLVLIEWLDSYGCSSTWESLDECKPRSMVCRSVGWLVHDADDCKVVVPHISNSSGHGCGDMTIPVKCILKLTVLKVDSCV